MAIVFIDDSYDLEDDGRNIQSWRGNIKSPAMRQTEFDVLDLYHTDKTKPLYFTKFKNPIYKLNKTYTETITNRKYIVIDIKSKIFTFEYVKFMANRHSDHIVFLIGDIKEVFTPRELLDYAKIINLKNISIFNQQNIVNLLFNCERLFTGFNDMLLFCNMHGLKVTFFSRDVDEKNRYPDGITLKKEQKVDINLVKTNPKCWQI